jgi:hypothetical protein
LGETGLIEGLDGTRDIPSLNSHLALLTEFVDFTLGPGGHIGVLLVEGFFEFRECVEIYKSN